MARRRIPDDVGCAAVAAVARHGDRETAAGPGRETIATAVRYLLQLLAESSAGNTVEVRVPPFGAVQCVPGPRHTRGTPPNVVEMDAPTWLALATGTLAWADGVTAGNIFSSGQRADLSPLVPVSLPSSSPDSRPQ